MNYLLAVIVVALFLTYVVWELGWGGSTRDIFYPSKRPAFPHWRPWRPTPDSPRDWNQPRPLKPDPRKPELVA